VNGKTLAAGAPVRIDAIHASIAAQTLTVDVAVSGPVCGAIAFHAVPSWDAQKARVVFALRASDDEIARVRGVAPSIDAAALAASLAPLLDHALPIDDTSLGVALDGLRVPLSEGGPALAVTLDKHAPEGIAIGEAIEARFVLEGRARIDLATR
jgi:hypothetical protein